MKSEKTENIQTAKKQKKKILVNTFASAGVLILLVIALFTLGWFTNNKVTEVDGANGQAVSGKFELAAEGTAGKYDNYLNADSGTALSGISDESSQPLENLVGTGNSTEIKWVMNGDSNFQNYSSNSEDTTEGIQPGSKGKLTFYVIPKQAGTLNLKFSLNTILYKGSAKEITESNDNSGSIISADDAAAKLVKGHILFFEKYNEESKIYSDRIDGMFTRKISDAKVDTAYKFDIYWVWPNVIDELVLPKDDSKFSTNTFNRIIGETDSVVTEGDNFFESSKNITTADITNVSAGSFVTGFSEETYNKLTYAWNSADQTIGINVRYIELQLIADENTETAVTTTTTTE